MKKCTKHLSRMLYSNQKGAILIWLIITMVVVSIIGSSTVYLTTSSTYGELFANYRMRAFYAAESGGRYAIPQVAQDPVAAEANLNGQTFTLSNGEKFVLIVNNFPTFTLLQSTGIINENNWTEARKTRSYLVPKPFSDQFDDPDSFANNWNVSGGSATIKKTGPSDREYALSIRGEEVTISLNWDGNTDLPDLAVLRSNNNGLLSYELQIKIKEDIQGSLGEHYMWGLSFRLNTVTDSTYGISFFRSIGRGDAQRPGWIDDLPFTFDVLMNGARYIALWKKVSGTYSLLDYKLLAVSDGVIETTGELKPWSTIIVQVFEVFDGGRENRISGYVQGTGSYPRNIINWNYGNFVAVQWNSNIQPIVDNSLTTDNFETLRPVEIGLHAYYDSPAANDQLYDDFAMNVLSSDGSVLVTPIQY